MSNRITKEWSDLCMCVIHVLMIVRDALYNITRKHHITLIYDESFHILIFKEQNAFLYLQA